MAHGQPKMDDTLKQKLVMLKERDRLSNIDLGKRFGIDEKYVRKILQQGKTLMLRVDSAQCMLVVAVILAAYCV